MSTPTPDSLREMAQLADALGPATRRSTLTVELRRVVTSTRSLFSAAACSCALIDGTGEALTFVAADGAGADEIVGVTLPAGEGLVGWTATSGQALIIGDVRDDPRFARDIAQRTGYVPRVIMAAPLVDDTGVVLGVLEVLDPSRAGTDHSGRLLEVLGLLASLATTVVRLSAVYDHLAGTLFTALEDASEVGGLGAALAALAEADDGPRTDVALLALAFHELAEAGPDETRLAESVLNEVARYVRGRR